MIGIKSLCKVFTFFSSPRGKKITANGWRAAGITEAVRDASRVSDILDPFAGLSLS